MLGINPSMPTVSGVPSSAVPSGSANINFAPTINVQGADAKQDVSQVLEQKMREFDRMMRRWFSDRRRLSFD